MIDLRSLRADPEPFRSSLRRRGIDLDLDEVVRLDASHRELLGEVESLRAEKKRASNRISELTGAEQEAAIQEARGLSDRLKQLERELDRVKTSLDERLSWMPNLVHPEVPEGVSEEDNRVLRQVGEAGEFDFPARDHLDIGEGLGIIDIERGAKVSGTRFAFLKGAGAVLELALVRFALDRLSAEGFLPVIPPVLVRREVLHGMGFFPASEDEAYEISRDGLFLVGTSEAPLAGMHAGEILPEPDLPLRYVAFSSCFRREAGTYGRDTRGIIRLHQFEKVEMFVLCRAEDSEEHHRRILAEEEAIFQALEVPYRVVDTCAGDLGAPYSRKFDLEAWLPGSERWLEVTSCSNALDFQARRLGIRTRTGDGTEFVHTLNGTAVTGRAIVALLENGQQADGSVSLPAALHPYAGFETIAAP